MVKEKEEKKAYVVAHGPKEVPRMTEPNSRLNLMAWKQATKEDEDPNEQLFVLKLQVKTSLVDAIVDSRSQKNLISKALVQKLGHVRRRSIGCLPSYSGQYLFVRKAKKLVNASKKFVLLFIRPYEEQLSRVCLTTLSKLQEGDLDRLKAKYADLFSEITGLPLRQSVEHEIMLMGESSTAHPYMSPRRSRSKFKNFWRWE
ncbi:uncharacterized protein A4U43_C06F14630 [Asparagus officinalis]|uniref:Uncharacterized protein n=1 Tax=Asparagus officinalis TaxID=4686 RepID=A0A5P1EM67_ASPOF|nr:uncharacterized protein A4U43_C06F14630 [Asparagus officinalis]